MNDSFVEQNINGVKILRSFTKKKRSYFECLCSCGNTFIARSEWIKKVGEKSCGCKTSDLISAARRLSNNQGVFNRILTVYKKNAETRGLTFSLSEKEFFELIKLPCYYCGSPPSLSRIIGSYNGRRERYAEYNGIDRVNSSVGYEHGNVVPCCKTCNFAKNDLSASEFESWIHQLINFHLHTKACCNGICTKKECCPG